MYQPEGNRSTALTQISSTPEAYGKKKPGRLARAFFVK
jgi:hypothetical protein